jgi:streptogramin lyase
VRTLLLLLVAMTFLVGSVSAGGFTGPVAITAGYGSVWVGLGTGELLEVDPGRAQLRARWLAGNAPYGFVHGLAATAGAVWVAGGNGLERVDPRARRARRVVSLRTPFTLVAGAGSVWAARDAPNGLTRIDPRRGRVVATVRVPGRLWGVGAGPAGVVILRVRTRGSVTGPWGPRVLQRVDLRTNRLIGPAIRLNCDQAIAVGRDYVWTSDQCTGRLERRDPGTLRPSASLALAPDRRLVLAFGSVWLVGGREVVRVDPASMRVIAKVRVRAVTAAPDASTLWLLDFGDGRTGFVRRLDPRTNRLVGKVIRLPS